MPGLPADIPTPPSTADALAAQLLRPMSPSDIVDTCFAVLRTRAVQLWLVSALAMGIPLMVEVVLAIFSGPGASAFHRTWVKILALLLTLLALAIVTAYASVVVMDIALQQPRRSMGATFALCRRKLPAAFLSAGLLWLVLSPAAAVLFYSRQQYQDAMIEQLDYIHGYGLDYFFTEWRYPALMLGAGLALLSVVALALRGALTVPVTTIELIYTTGAIRRSWQLTRGSWWRLIGTALILAVGCFVVYLVLGNVLSGYGEQMMRAAAYEGNMAGTVAGAMATKFGQYLAWVLILPIVGLACAISYLDARIRREGLDVQIRYAHSGQSAPQRSD